MVINLIKRATKSFEAENVPTIHLVVPELFEIHDALSELAKDDGVVSEFAGILKRSFKRRFPDCGSRVELYAIAHLLDPKNKGCVLEVYHGAYETARESLLKICQKFDKTPPQDPGTDDPCSRCWARGGGQWRNYERYGESQETKVKPDLEIEISQQLSWRSSLKRNFKFVILINMTLSILSTVYLG